MDLSECLHVSGTEIVKGLKGSGAGGAQLESLNLKSCTYIRVSCCLYCKFVFVTGKSAHETFIFLLCVQDFAVFSFTQLLGDTLRELDLTSCVNVTDLSVRSIATYLHRLVILRLGWCKEVTDWGLLGMVETTKCDPDQEMVRLTHMWMLKVSDRSRRAVRGPTELGPTQSEKIVMSLELPACIVDMDTSDMSPTYGISVPFVPRMMQHVFLSRLQRQHE